MTPKLKMSVPVVTPPCASLKHSGALPAVQGATDFISGMLALVPAASSHMYAIVPTSIFFVDKQVLYLHRASPDDAPD